MQTRPMTINMNCISSQRGYSLIDVIITVVIVGLLFSLAISKIPSGDSTTLRVQVEKFAYDLRRAQILSTTRGSGLCVRVSSATNYSVNQFLVGRTDCGGLSDPQTPLTDPLSKAVVQGQLTNGAIFSSYPSVDLVFNSLGQPNNAAAYTISVSGSSYQVQVNAVTGNVSVN